MIAQQQRMLKQAEQQKRFNQMYRNRDESYNLFWTSKVTSKNYDITKDTFRSRMEARSKMTEIRASQRREGAVNAIIMA